MKWDVSDSYVRKQTNDDHNGKGIPKSSIIQVVELHSTVFCGVSRNDMLNGKKGNWTANSPWFVIIINQPQTGSIIK